MKNLIEIEKKQNLKSHKPVVAIVGRPNVGKSTLFNRLIESRKAIVENTPGVTRDRIYSDVLWGGYKFTIIDTGGIVPYPEDNNQSLIREQVQIAIDEADLILFLLDERSGVMPDDREIVGYLRRCEKPILYVVNKVDHDKHELNTFEFHDLGAEEIIPISALHNRNIYELIEKIVGYLPRREDSPGDNDDDNIVKLTVIGKPNVGKSTFVNLILGEQRFITSPQPGTTRDAIDSEFTYGDKKYMIIDTAGIRRKSRVSDTVEIYSVNRAIKAIERSDIVLFMIDGPEGPTHQDARLARLVRERGKASIILVNKCDLAPGELADEDILGEIVPERLRAIDYAPVLAISAKTGSGTHDLFDIIDEIKENFYRKITTKKLNVFLKKVIKKRALPSIDGKELKFYYITQVKTGPPVFVIFTNATQPVPDNYSRFLENQLRSGFELVGVPLRILFRTRLSD